MAQAWFENQRMRKLYEGLTAVAKAGSMEWEEWTCKLERGKKRAFIADHGKPAKTLARRVGETGGFARWELVAVTGRPHQLRFEMFRHDCPLLGDTLYGGKPVKTENWIGLHAVEAILK